jgi:hypothetical protein
MHIGDAFPLNDSLIGAMNAIKIAFNKGGKNLWLGLDSMLVYKNSSIFFMLFYYV